MTRHVYDNRQVAHIWANQSQSSARSHNGQFYFEGPIIYSYGPHFPIACFFADATGRPRVAYNAEKISVTTTKHQSYVRWALSREQDEAVLSFDGLSVYTVAHLIAGRWSAAWRTIRETALRRAVCVANDIASTKHKKRIENLSAKLAAVVSNAGQWAAALGCYADWQTTFNEGNHHA